MDQSPGMCVPLTIETYLKNCNGGSGTLVSRRTFTRSACTWKSAQVLPFFSKILIHMHNLKMCSGSSSSGRLTVASIAFNSNFMLRCAYHLSPPCPPISMLGHRVSRVLRRSLLEHAPSLRIQALVAESPGQFRCLIMLWRLPGRSPRESRPCS